MKRVEHPHEVKILHSDPSVDSTRFLYVVATVLRERPDEIGESALLRLCHADRQLVDLIELAAVDVALSIEWRCWWWRRCWVRIVAVRIRMSIVSVFTQLKRVDAVGELLHETEVALQWHSFAGECVL